MRNIIAKCNTALWNKTFADGLSSYTQANCQVTLTNDGYRIYRPPNKTQSSDGNTMWGGLIIQPFSADSNAMIKGHKYTIKFEVKGKTSAAVGDIRWSNSAGWEGGGLKPTPSDITSNRNDFGANFQSDIWIPFQYIFTINDDIYKVCTSSYSSFVAGQTYLSYRDFKFGFDYVSTGEMGTDLYLRNFKLYDITTSSQEIKIHKTGVWHAGDFTEAGTMVSEKCDGDQYASQFYEL